MLQATERLPARRRGSLTHQLRNLGERDRSFVREGVVINNPRPRVVTRSAWLVGTFTCEVKPNPPRGTLVVRHRKRVHRGHRCIGHATMNSHLTQCGVQTVETVPGMPRSNGEIATEMSKGLNHDRIPVA